MSYNTDLNNTHTTITSIENNGFTIEYPNRLTLSARWNSMNYADRITPKGKSLSDRNLTECSATSVEVAVWDGERRGEFLKTPWTRDDQVVPYVTPYLLTQMMQWVCRIVRTDEGNLIDEFGVRVVPATFLAVDLDELS